MESALESMESVSESMESTGAKRALESKMSHICLKCKTRTPSESCEIKTSKNGRKYELSRCKVCGGMKSSFLKQNTKAQWKK